MDKDKQLKHWLNQLCKNMNSAIESSGSIHQCIHQIKAQGFDLCVFLEATVCLSQTGETPFARYKKAVSSKAAGTSRRLSLSRKDRARLGAMKISVATDKPDSAKQGP